MGLLAKLFGARTFHPEDQRRYMDEMDFVPNALGLGDVRAKCFRLVMMPSFHPEEVWDVSHTGDIIVTAALESIWGSIPQRLKTGDGPWEYRTESAFVRGKHTRRVYTGCSVTSERFLRAHAEYSAPKECCLDGIGVVCSYLEKGDVVYDSIPSPEESEFLDCIKAALSDMRKRGYVSGVGGYFGVV